MGNNLGFYNKVRAKKKFLGLGEVSGWGEVRNKILVWGHNSRLVATFCVGVKIVLGATFWVRG